ncbi:MAG TPA: formate dehydrogenase subunit delta [Methylophilaceae bacterium]|jgi:formate dehydrogenase subunit delta
MANQIGDFFLSIPDSEEAKKEIADHLKKFWALSMRKQLVAHMECNQAQGAGLNPMVGEAIKENMNSLTV